ncbi:MAG: hypothetical protein KC729_00870 [Candidatus Eisenbacteria bacterium]|uniref:DUF4097 domain-containing protein n=1 Tax=Eiseniibacteriota bacterium TaxID=2212470 RepID=A0A956LVA9_UNCEI|nr:hypothetical protein [Candidatus Eisenbacteria bacterium]
MNDGATVTVTDFVGSIRYRTGESGTVRVSATKRAASRSDLHRIDLTMIETAHGIEVKARNPENTRDTSVDLEVTTPEVTNPQVTVGVGDILYGGRPEGWCSFEAGVGTIRLWLSDDIDIEVDLTSGVGTITSELPIRGASSSVPAMVKGTIGDGTGGHIHATTGVGNIQLLKR